MYKRLNNKSCCKNIWKVKEDRTIELLMIIDSIQRKQAKGNKKETLCRLIKASLNLLRKELQMLKLFKNHF